MKQNKDHFFLHTLSTGQIFILQKQIGLQFAQVYLLQKKRPKCDATVSANTAFLVFLSK